MAKVILPISVLIPTMNRPESLKRTIEGYMNADGIPRQIVVVDQSEDEESRKKNQDILKSTKEAACDYIFQKVPSLTKARNTALSAATEDILVCSDDDVDVYQDTLLNVYSLMKDDTIAMIAGIDDNMELGRSKIGYLLGTKSFRNRHIGHVTKSVLGRFPDKIDGITSTMWAMGFFFIVRKSLIEKWSISWDEKLTGYAYAEDLDFSYEYYKKALTDNLRCIYSPAVHVAHLASKEYRIPTRKSTFMYVNNREYLRYKHRMGHRSYIAMQWCNFWIYVQRIIQCNSPEDMKDAIHYMKTNKKEIRKGNFNY